VKKMKAEDLVLQGNHIRLEPLNHSHADGLVTAAAGADALLYRWTPVPQNKTEAEKYIETAIAWKEAGTCVPFATIRIADGAVIGSTRFWNIEYWPWPQGHPSHGRESPDACEIGYTWLTSSAIRTRANTEAKLLMLTHAFESWRVHRVAFHTDARNLRSAAALDRIGGKFEGVLRAHRMAVDHIARDSLRFSIIDSEWPEVKQRLLQRRDRV
jgi:RimJ/RimL family protein N-acetyltransferase